MGNNKLCVGGINSFFGIYFFGVLLYNLCEMFGSFGKVWVIVIVFVVFFILYICYFFISKLSICWKGIELRINCDGSLLY